MISSLHHTFPVANTLCTISLMRGRGPFHSSPKSGQLPRKWAFETRSGRSGYRRTGYIIHPVPFNRENMRWAWESNSRYAMVSCRRGTLPVCTDHIIHPVSFKCENMHWDLTKFPVHNGFSQARYFAYLYFRITHPVPFNREKMRWDLRTKFQYTISRSPSSCLFFEMSN